MPLNRLRVYDALQRVTTTILAGTAILGMTYISMNVFRNYQRKKELRKLGLDKPTVPIKSEISKLGDDKD
ncbi:hypothetical protein EV182_000565 [Spiromyces aspiralis]|uniref:Uncharacterized protein n=1 Tax=Spiromyces aspiralis TaxID=68401 RepID=A0ACC1HUC2_9FUNG|nr:hypothetical protein EV182_000565 [Spiromyces aspiralis]